MSEDGGDTSHHVRAREDTDYLQRPTEDQKAQYLQLISSGTEPVLAAAEVGSTATRFRRLRNPSAYSYDADFTRAYDEAMEERWELHREKLRKTLHGIAFDPEHPQQLRAALAEAEAHLPEYEHKRSRTVRHGNAEDGPLQIQAIPWISTEALEAMPLEEKRQLLEMLERLRKPEDGPQLRAIEGGSPE